MEDLTPQADGTVGVLSPTAARFVALPQADKDRAITRLDSLARSGSESRVRPAIAYFLAETRGVERVSYGTLLNDVRSHAVTLGLQAAIGADTPTGIRNFSNFLSRGTGDPSGPMVSCCALYAVHLLETRPELADGLCFAHQLRILDWVRSVLGGAHTQPVPSEPDLDPDATQALTSADYVLHNIKSFLDNRIRNSISDEKLRESLHLDPDTDQVGYLCFRSAFNRSFQTVQSYLAILAPERNGTPFWTFSLFSEGSDSRRIRVAGGIALATQSTLYLIGGEGSALAADLHAGQSVYTNLKARNFIAFALPIDAFSDTPRIVPGIALTANGDGTPVVGRIALRRVEAQMHEGLVGLGEFDKLIKTLTALYPKDAPTEGDEPARPDLTLIQEEARRILAVINNNAAFEFFDAVEKESGKTRRSDYLKDRISTLFRADGEAVFETPDGDDYSFDRQRWTHVLGWWMKLPDQP